MVAIGYSTIRASSGRAGLALDLGNAPSHIVGSAVPWLPYLMIAVVAGIVLVLAGRRWVLPDVVAVTALVLVVVLLATGPSGQLNPFVDAQPNLLGWAVRGADSTATHVLIVALAGLALGWWGRPSDAGQGPPGPPQGRPENDPPG